MRERGLSYGFGQFDGLPPKTLHLHWIWVHFQVFKQVAGLPAACDCGGGDGFERHAFCPVHKRHVEPKDYS